MSKKAINYRRLSGYTLMELVITIGLIGFIMTTATTLLFAILRSESKASALAVIKQNGDHAIGFIEREARFARSAICTAGPTLEIVDIDGVMTAISIDAATDRLQYSVGPTFLTSDGLVVSNFTCNVIDNGVQPDIVEASFVMAVGAGGKTSELVQESFETRVSLRSY